MSLAAVIEWCKSEVAATPATPQISMVLQQKSTFFIGENDAATPATLATPQTSKVQTRTDKFAEKEPATPTGPPAAMPVPVAANKALYTRLVLAAYRACESPEQRLSMREECLALDAESVPGWIDHFESAYSAAPPPAPGNVGIAAMRQQLLDAAERICDFHESTAAGRHSLRLHCLGIEPQCMQWWIDSYEKSYPKTPS